MGHNSASLIDQWDTLSTVTTFDRGSDDTQTTARLEKESNQRDRQIVSTIAPSTSLLIQSLVQQLCMLFEEDSMRRSKLYFAICNRLHQLKLIDSTYNMVEFESLRGQYQRALYQLFTVARAATTSENALQVPSTLITEWSRYHKEFQEVSFIAAGGFGNVFKAVNCLDGTEYAIKKIIVRSGRVKSLMQHLDEVKTLAKLNHTNIVSYKGAWIEPTLPSNFIPSLVSASHSQSRISSKERQRNVRLHSLGTHSHSSSGNSWSNQNAKKTDDQMILLRHSEAVNGKSEEHVEKNIRRTDSNSISFRCDDNCTSEDNVLESHINYTEHSNSCDQFCSSRKILPYVPKMDDTYATLYIQMALCEKTLQQWLDERIQVTPQGMIVAIVTQILCGLHYIHSRGIVHHDIKPSNIFISTSGQLQIQLGDFGLACPLQKESHPTIFGTQLYAAPEQLQGKCNPKSDMYSLGIVLLELLVHTRTYMERIEIINGLKRGQIGTILTATYPKWVHMVSQLVQEDPEKRPSSNQLLQDLNKDKDLTIARLRDDLAQKDEVIRELEKRISILEGQAPERDISLKDI